MLFRVDLFVLIKTLLNCIEFIGNKDGIGYSYNFNNDNVTEEWIDINEMNITCFHAGCSELFLITNPIIPRNLDGIILLSKKLIIMNLAGFNRDVRSRRDEYMERFGMDFETLDYLYYPTNDRDAAYAAEFNVKIPSWYTNYQMSYCKYCPNGITLKDIAIGVMEVKSGKMDRHYELFCGAKPEFYNDILILNLEFDHGS